MTKLETILEQTKALSPTEREQLLRLLSTQSFGHGPDDETAVGTRGLAAWTESTRGDDWSMFYPDTLRNGRRPPS